MPNPKMFKRRCEHQVLQVVAFNPVGAVVGCVLCELTFDLDDQAMVKNYIPFTHTSPFGKDEDNHILIHEGLIK